MLYLIMRVESSSFMDMEELERLLWKTLSIKLHSKGQIVLNVASSGIALLLLPRGRITHSRFSIPLIINKSYPCNIC